MIVPLKQAQRRSSSNTLDMDLYDTTDHVPGCCDAVSVQGNVLSSTFSHVRKYGQEVGGCNHHAMHQLYSLFISPL